MPSSHRRHFGSIRKLPSGRFQTSYWHKDRHYLAPSTFRTKGDAQAWLSSIETDIARGTWLDPAGAKVTVGGWLQHWLATVVDGRVDSDNTRSKCPCAPGRAAVELCTRRRSPGPHHQPKEPGLHGHGHRLLPGACFLLV